MLKVYAGLYKGRKLKSFKGDFIRPTISRVKLSFFDSIQEEIKEKIFLDGFAGTGSIGIEALSRGAEYVIFIDELKESVKIINHNLEKIGIDEGKYRVIKGDFNRSIIHLSKDGFKFDIIYLDPPYELLRVSNPLKVLFKREVIAENGFVVLEKPDYIKFNSKYFDKFKENKIGNKILEFYRLKE